MLWAGLFSDSDLGPRHFKHLVARQHLCHIEIRNRLRLGLPIRPRTSVCYATASDRFNDLRDLALDPCDKAWRVLRVMTTVFTVTVV